VPRGPARPDVKRTKGRKVVRVRGAKMLRTKAAPSAQLGNFTQILIVEFCNVSLELLKI
jgi:hypothetical protein